MLAFGKKGANAFEVKWVFVKSHWLCYRPLETDFEQVTI